MGCTMRKRVFGHMRTEKAQVSLRIRAAQSDQDLYCPLTELFDTIECIIEEQRSSWYFAHAQDDVNMRILHMFESAFSASPGPNDLKIRSHREQILARWGKVFHIVLYQCGMTSLRVQ